eukprot:Nk52_evm1s683 gene=Nk52_evmTU1s683
MKIQIWALLVVCVTLWLSNTAVSAEDKMEAKFKALRELADANPDNLVYVDEKSYRLFVSQQPKNYTSFVVFSALESYHKCEPCQYLHSQYQLVAKQYRDVENVFFFVADFDRAKELFQKLKIQSAPVFKAVGPKATTAKAVDYHVNMHGLEAEAVVEFVTQNVPGLKPRQIERPASYSGLILGLFTLVAFGALCYKASNTVIAMLTTPFFWGSMSLFLTFVFLSGQMWNHIRNAPFMQVDQRGNSVLIVPNSGSQVGKESMVISFVYAMITSFFILLFTLPLFSNKGPGISIQVVALEAK